MALSDYRFREDGRPRMIHFSGGRTSAYLLFHTLEAYGGSLPGMSASPIATPARSARKR